MRYDLYVDSYRRYKAGTNTVARWLLRTGRACGAAIDTDPKPGQRYFMPLSEFKQLATIIAGQSSSVPSHIISSLRETIDLRKAASLFYRQHASSNDLERSNEGHIFTIEVLESVWNLLVPFQTEDLPETVRPTADDEGRRKPVSNIFDVAGSDSSVDHDRGSGSQIPQPNPPTIEPVVEIGSDPEEIFVLYCFFRDLHDVREELRRIWRMYKCGETPLISAAATTDLAFDVARRRETEMLNMEFTLTGGKVQTLREVAAELYNSHTISGTRLFWRLKDNFQFNHVGDLLFRHIAETGNVDTPTDGKVEDAIEEQIFHAAEMLGIPAYIMLDNYEAIRFGRPLNGEAHLQFASRHTLRTPAINAQFRFGDDDGRMAVLQHQMRLLHAMDWHRQIPSDKRFGPLQGRQGRNLLPAWLVWATSVQLDINRILGRKRHQPFAELKDTGHELEVRAQSYMQWLSTAYRQGWDIKLDKVFGGMQIFVQTYLDENPIAKAEKKTFPDLPPTPPHILFRYNQTWAGVLDLWLKLSLWSIGIRIATFTTILFFMMHLYNAGLSDRLSWDDMEYVISLHGAEHLFYGGRPDGPAECEKRMHLCAGGSAQESASDRRSFRFPRSARGREKAERQIRPDVISTYILRKRYQDIDSLYKDETVPTGGLEVLMAFLRRTQQQEVAKLHSQSNYLVPLLDMVHSTVAQDARHLQFDCEYPSLYKPQRADLLQDGLHEDLEFGGRVCRSTFLSKNRLSAQAIPSFILTARRDAAESGPTDPVAIRLGAIGPRAFAIMRRYLELEGSSCIHKMDHQLKRPADRVDALAEESDHDASQPQNDLNTGELDRQLGNFTKSLNIAREKDAANGPEKTEAARRAEARGRGELMETIDVMSEIASPAKLPPEDVQKFLATDDLTPLFGILKANLDIERAKEKKRKSNKNKIKNRKLKQKAEQNASGEGLLATSNRGHGSSIARNEEPPKPKVDLAAVYFERIERFRQEGVNPFEEFGIDEMTPALRAHIERDARDLEMRHAVGRR
ncbi:hypothetical protein EJ03DRAFT_371588 [Teratosphaeria nubilosa]|uniref:DUF6604 domain-containing protein n=1 Tax=Teratosphaeria nubilosa TaxID=161662 RepID=A0A6G1LJV1_9PEZI|nr:hypothetical protein EJ03DRAFT_371588 [Teratosphaeria nubilosa]